MNVHVRGFTLLESVIALLLLSLGLLGAWAVLLASLQSHADALRQVHATLLVRDMADRIRANPAAGHLYDSAVATPGGAACDAAAPCDAAQLAAADLLAFADAARRELPGNDTSATVHYEPAIGAAAADRYAISLRWRGARDLNVVALQLLLAPVAGAT
jgi:type IV pilus assembly protein PilV